MKMLLLWTIAAVCLMAPAAQARSAYDGSWDLVFVTQGGACDPSYNFTVNISDGIVTHPNLVKFRGYVREIRFGPRFGRGSRQIRVRHGQTSGNSGRGRWSGYSGSSRCSGYWTAQRN